MKVEEWKDIVGYEGMYMVSNLGRVKSLDRKVEYLDGRKYFYKSKILTTSIKGNGYYTVSLQKNNKPKNYYVHRLVASAFLDNNKSLPQVNHKDEDKGNNSVENLEWCTPKYNNNYKGKAKRVATKIDYSIVSKKNSKKVYQYSNDFKLIKIWDSVISTKEYGYNPSCVSSCCRGEKKTHLSFIWSYEQYKEEF